MRSVFVILLFLSSSVFAAECFNISKDDIEVKWTAYKTPAKAPVSGTLPSFKIQAPKKATSIKNAMKKASISIEGTSVFTKNKQRDKKIARFFFKNAKNDGNINASVKKVTNKKIEMNLSFNGITKTIPLSYSIENNILKAKGFMDILDFSASKSLKAINKACLALHEGKTWSDVALELTAHFKPCS